MGFFTILIFGLAMAGNIAVIKFKLERYRYSDATVDAVVLVVLTYIFGGSIAGLAVATVASVFFSMYLLVSPPDILLNRMTEKKSKKKKKKRRKQGVKYAP